MRIPHVRRDELEALVQLTEENLAVARTALKEGHYRSAVSKGYYAFLDMAKALLLARHVVTHSHRGTLDLFSQQFIKTGIVPRDYGRWFRQAFKARLEADYEALRKFTLSEAEEAVTKAEEFFMLAQRLLQQKLGSAP